MSNSSAVSLGSLRIQAQQKADMENNPFISTSEWNNYINQSYKELYDMLVSAYGNEYYVANTYTFQTSGATQYSLPDGTPSFVDDSGQTAQKFYKLLGVDLQYSASPSGYVSLRRFEFIERNKYAYPNTTINTNGYTNLRYRINGDKLFLIPIPSSGQSTRIWYVPAPTNLQYVLPSSVTTSSTTVTMTSTAGLAIGMNVSGPGLTTVQANTVISTLTSTSMALSLPTTLTNPSAILSYWSDSTTMEGISGWEEYVVIDAAIKAQIKQESDFQPLMVQKQEMKQRIESMAEGRDIGQAHHVSDVLSLNNFEGMFGNSSGFDGGGW